MCFLVYALIVCTNYMNYIRGRMYIGNENTRVEKVTLGVQETNGYVGDVS